MLSILPVFCLQCLLLFNSSLVPTEVKSHEAIGSGQELLKSSQFKGHLVTQQYFHRNVGKKKYLIVPFIYVIRSKFSICVFFFFFGF